MKTIIKILIVLILAILVYNYFVGTPEEKKQSQQIFNEVKGLAGSVAELVQDEHQKFKEGKYDKILDNLKGIYDKMEEAWKDSKPELMDKLKALEEKRDELEMADKNSADSTKIEQYKQELKQLLRETEELLEQDH
jgi:membrane-associated HD superfamily phosphohydrolase